MKVSHRYMFTVSSLVRFGFVVLSRFWQSKAEYCIEYGNVVGSHAEDHDRVHL